MSPEGTLATVPVSEREMMQAGHVARAAASAAACAYLALTLLSGLGRFHWMAELLTHFRVQAVVAGAFLGLCCVLLRAHKTAAAVLVLALAQGVPLLPYLVPGSAPGEATQRPETAPRLRVLQLNVHTANRRHAAVEALVRAEGPDLLALLEVNQRWLDALEGLHAQYPHRIARAQEDNFGIALFSRFPIDDLRLRPLAHARMYMITGSFSLGDTPINLALAHPVPPASERWAALRNRQLDALSGLANRDVASETLLLGDLNTTPWSPVYARFERTSGLRNGARGLGLFPTWPAGFAPLRIPIDHFLVSKGLRVARLEVGPEVGSDHLPVLVEIAPGV